MIAKLLGLALIAATAVSLSLSDLPTLAGVGCSLFVVIGIMGFGLCVMAGEVSDKDLDESNELHRTDDLDEEN